MTLASILLATLLAGVGSVWLAALLGLGLLARFTQNLLSLAAGALLATAFTLLLPEAFESGVQPSYLLGTVLGIIEAFLGVARGGSGNLAAIAPGVAEALIATAMALAVAIPAYFGYNIFAARLNRFDGELDGFGTEVIALMAREGRL